MQVGVLSLWPGKIAGFCGQKKPPITGGLLFVTCDLVAVILAAAGAGFMNADLGKLRQQRLDLVPDPLSNHLAGRILQARDVVQVIVVELFIERLEDRLDLGKVADPACMRIERAGQVQCDLERVAMQAPALMPVGYVRQAVGGFEREFFENFHGVYNS